MTQGLLFPAIPEEIRSRIERALADPVTTPCAKAVLRTMLSRFAVGRIRAVGIEALQERWQGMGNKIFSAREVKAAVKHLIESHGIPIGSARCTPVGYFICVTAEDIDEAERPLVNEVKSLARRLRCINAKSEISRILCGQLGIHE